jgi:hypothetical protein
MNSSVAMPTLIVPFLSTNNKYQQKDNLFTDGVLYTTKRFNTEIGDGEDDNLIIIKSIGTENGVVIISGHSCATRSAEDDPSCCPSFHFSYDFHYYADQTGKGYVTIIGTYTEYNTEQEEKMRNAFNLRISSYTSELVQEL